MLLQQLNRRVFYSKNAITEDFINDILAKAKKATEAPTTSIKNRPRVANREDYRNRSKYRQRNANTIVASNDIPSPGNLATTVKIEQAQFKNKRGNQENSSDLLDLFDTAPVAGNNGAMISSAKNMVKYKARNGNAQRHRRGPGSSRSSTNARPFNLRRNSAIVMEQPEYVPPNDFYDLQEPTPQSLLQYYPSLSHTKRSRLINFAHKTLVESNYPIYRNPKLNNNDITFLPRMVSFGKYMPGTSVILEKEKLLKNNAIHINQEKYSCMTNGSYYTIPEAIAGNSNILNGIRLSLQRNSDLNSTKERVDSLYNICAGKKPITKLM
ncbi:hypothetical protein KAFR_0A08150 [Kazachstania africana CBS 2517]|uniref:37S ribosomal protein RSM28, mitochondrial n=1 Tax=Kazachstania africana (strain ATCC 22294 / BCRC 22015 / CBS 2517 / CECT 1963 / NBRC 1671 / NRRL Y-8276) TaxID=1071382 RepID=H2APE9_KAZAF|nr:hypothetical protein KAFR_0A08150 [Kazachstania africana CBS 2517]CCF56249.1 hypothetical protein KAFR_0A08150 [Kazachstania africana CBS 2517]